MRVLVYADLQEDLASLTARLDANGHSTTGTVIDELAIDLAASSEFEAFVIDRHASPARQLRLTTEISRRSPAILVIRANGPEAVLTQLRQAAAERTADLSARGDDHPSAGAE